MSAFPAEVGGFPGCTRDPDSVLNIAVNISQQPPSARLISTEDTESLKIESMKLKSQATFDNLVDSLDGAVRLANHVNHYELTDYYNLADFVVHPAIGNEPFGMTLTEAMAFSMALVSTRAGGTPEIVKPDEMVVLGDTESPAKLAKAINRLQKTNQLGEQMGRRGRIVAHTKLS